MAGDDYENHVLVLLFRSSFYEELFDGINNYP